MNNVEKILIVEDDLIASYALAMHLKKEGFTVLDQVPTADQLVSLYEKLHPDLILLDIRLAGHVTGTEAAMSLRQVSQVPIIFLTAYNDENTLQDINQIPNSHLLSKPYNHIEVIQKLTSI